MNERFLSRGKRKDNGAWVEGYYACQSNHACFLSALKYRHFIFKDVCVDFNLGGLGEYDVIPATVGRCTGLEDKNGKLIFEGDIVKNKAWYVIKYDNGGYGLSAFGKTKPIPIMGHWNFNSDEIEVIGNIHDNPELLEVER